MAIRNKHSSRDKLQPTNNYQQCLILSFTRFCFLKAAPIGSIGRIEYSIHPFQGRRGSHRRALAIRTRQEHKAPPTLYKISDTYSHALQCYFIICVTLHGNAIRWVTAGRRGSPCVTGNLGAVVERQCTARHTEDQIHQNRPPVIALTFYFRFVCMLVAGYMRVLMLEAPSRRRLLALQQPAAAMTARNAVRRF